MPLKARVMVTVRTPPTTPFEVTATEVARRRPAAWLSSFCSNTVPFPLTMIALGISAIACAPSPQPNHLPSGPTSVMVATPVPAAAFGSSDTLNVRSEVAEPESTPSPPAPQAEVPAARVLK
jgi:hypothetical protein